MTEPIPFPTPEHAPDELTRDELLDRMQSLQDALAALDDEEPEDMASDRYTRWADRHEALEDALGAYCRSFQRVLSDSAQENEHFTLTWEE